MTEERIYIYHKDKKGRLVYTKEFIEWFYTKVEDPEKWLGADWDKPHDFILKEKG